MRDTSFVRVSGGKVSAEEPIQPFRLEKVSKSFLKRINRICAFDKRFQTFLTERSENAYQPFTRV